LNINPSKIACVSFSGQMMGCLPVDEKGRALRRSIIWADQRAVAETEFVRAAFGGDRMYEVTGTSVAPNYSLEKILWLKNNERDTYDKACKFLNAKDYIVYRLTGNFATDCSDASGTNLFDIKKKVWSHDIVKATGVDASKLPDVYVSTDVVGGVTAEAAQETGLMPGTPVVIGGGDGPCATVGAGAVEEGDIYNYFGSSSWISVTTSKPLYDPNQATFNLCHLDPEFYMAPGTMQSAGGSYEWMREVLSDIGKVAKGEALTLDFEALNAEAMKSVPGAHALLFLPYLMGERCPYWNPDARGAFIGLTRGHTLADIIRAVFEGPIFNLRVIIDLFQAQGIRSSEIRLIGGAVKSDFICRLMADIYEMDVLRPYVLEEATSFGAAVAGGVGVGMYKGFHVVKDMIRIKDRIKPEESNCAKYRALYPAFKNAYTQLIDIFKVLAGQ